MFKIYISTRNNYIKFKAIAFFLSMSPIHAYFVSIIDYIESVCFKREKKLYCLRLGSKPYKKFNEEKLAHARKAAAFFQIITSDKPNFQIFVFDLQDQDSTRSDISQTLSSAKKGRI